jgi:hypothetical protein
MPRSRQLSALLVVLGLALAACGGDDDKDADPQPTTTSPSTEATTTTESPEAADEQALRHLAEDWYEASDAIYQGEAEPESAADYLIDPYLAAFVARARDVLAAGQISEPNEESRLEVKAIEIEGNDARVVECVIDADVLSGPDGAVVNDDLVASLFETEAVREAGGWKFADRRTLAEVPGSTECPTA